MKLLGLSAGRKLGNNEVLVKEALMAAEGEGIEVGMIRLLDLDLKPCLGCLACFLSLINGGSGKCPVKDDFHLLDEQIMQSDGIILGSPVFVLAPHGLIKDLSDRLGPSHDLSFRAASKKIREARGITDKEGPDERCFKRRVAGFIAVGGDDSLEPNVMALPLMNLFTLSMHIKVVDQMLVGGTSLFENVVMNPPSLERARTLGRNVAAAMKDTRATVTWKGDEPGMCPSCHSNLFNIKGKNPVLCPICGIRGELKVDGENITISFSEEELKKSRLNKDMDTMMKRYDELDENLQQRPDLSLIAKKLEKYKGYREIKLR